MRQAAGTTFQRPSCPKGKDHHQDQGRRKLSAFASRIRFRFGLHHNHGQLSQREQADTDQLFRHGQAIHPDLDVTDPAAELNDKLVPSRFVKAGLS